MDRVTFLFFGEEARAGALAGQAVSEASFGTEFFCALMFSKTIVITGGPGSRLLARTEDVCSVIFRATGTRKSLGDFACFENRGEILGLKVSCGDKMVYLIHSSPGKARQAQALLAPRTQPCYLPAAMPQVRAPQIRPDAESTPPHSLTRGRYIPKAAPSEPDGEYPHRHAVAEDKPHRPPVEKKHSPVPDGAEVHPIVRHAAMKRVLLAVACIIFLFSVGFMIYRVMGRKTADAGAGRAASGQKLIQTITVRNLSSEAVYDYPVRGTVPAGAAFVSGSARINGAAGGSYDPLTNAVSWCVPYLAANAACTLSFEAMANEAGGGAGPKTGGASVGVAVLLLSLSGTLIGIMIIPPGMGKIH